MGSLCSTMGPNGPVEPMTVEPMTAESETAAARHGRAARLRIVEVGDGTWRLVGDPVPVGVWRHDLERRYHSRRAARTGAVHLEVVRVRRMKLTRHLVMTVVFATAAWWSHGLVERPGEVHRIEWFAVAVVGAVLALSEMLAAFLLTIDNGWDPGYEVPQVTALDRFVGRVVLQHPAQRTAHGDTRQAPVRIIDADTHGETASWR